MLVSKLKEALICLKAGRVTLPYPFEPAPPKGDFRGMPKIDIEKCIGCGGCASVCPSSLIEMIDNMDHITVRRHFSRCIYCGRCEEMCPENAIKMTSDFETATNDRNDLVVTHHIYMATCSRCGRCFSTQTPIDPPDYRNFRDMRLKKLGARK
ncbi:4Fe-4S binding protein [bacterium]|nr:4Fe-4S binding protein [bacterium]